MIRSRWARPIASRGRALSRCGLHGSDGCSGDQAQPPGGRALVAAEQADGVEHGHAWLSMPRAIRHVWTFRPSRGRARAVRLDPSWA